MFDAIKKFIRWKKDTPTKDTPLEYEIPELGVDLGLPKPSIVPMPIVADESYANNLLNKPKNDVKYINNQERGFMSEKYLVVLDTSNRPEVTDRGLKGGLKNFYFVNATTPDQAKQIVLSTFARNPQIIKQIQYSLSVTPLGRIAPHVNEQTPIWSYIPLRKGSKAPGQQSTPPMQAVNPDNREEIIPMQEPPAPMTPPTQNDTPKMAEIPPEAQATNPMSAFMTPTLPNGQPNPMFAMMQMMSAMMQGGAAPVAQAPPQAVVTRGDPENDPELRRNMQEVLSTAVPRHQNSDPEALQEEFTHAERRNTSEVEQFKQLDKSEQAARGLTSVSNDIDPELMKKMLVVKDRMGNTPAPEESKGKKKR